MHLRLYFAAIQYGWQRIFFKSDMASSKNYLASCGWLQFGAEK
jgi:hypothetical protein